MTNSYSLSEQSADQRRIAALESELATWRTWAERASEVCREAAKGNLEPRILRIKAPGELGELCRSINGLLDLTDAFVREAGATLDCASKGQFHRRVLEHGMLGSFRSTSKLLNTASDSMQAGHKALEHARTARLELADQFETSIAAAVETVASAATELRATADGLSENAQSTRETSARVQKGADESTQHAELMASATEELTASMREINEQVLRSNDISRKAVIGANVASENMGALTMASQRIGTVTQLIRQVAEQTNLLALNATIEAARAGDIGKGFAVVASEVKNLSGQTGNATGEIESQVNDIRGATEAVEKAIQDVSATIAMNNDVANSIGAAMEEQGAVTREVTNGTSKVATGAKDISKAIGEVTGTVDLILDSSRDVADAAAELSRMGEGMRGDVANFLKLIRSDD